MRAEETNYGNTKEILYTVAHHAAVAVTVSADGVTADAAGRKIVPAGTIMTGIRSADGATAANDATAEGVLLHDVDVRFGDAPGTVVVHGLINAQHLPEAPTAEAIAVLPMIKFMGIEQTEGEG